MVVRGEQGFDRLSPNGFYMDDLRTTDSDRALGFTIPARHARGRVVRLGPVLDTILEIGRAHV